jgi:hypothetical protein
LAILVGKNMGEKNANSKKNVNNKKIQKIGIGNLKKRNVTPNLSFKKFILAIPTLNT